MSIEFSLIPPTVEAAKFICDLRNERSILQMSSFPIKREFTAFYASEFVDRYVTSASNLAYFIVYQGKKIGVFALEKTKTLQKNTKEVSIFLSEQYRSRGLGTLALNYGIEHAKKMGIDTLIATIKNENEASKKLFLSCGFQKKETYVLHLYPSNPVRIIAEIGSNFKAKSDLESRNRAFQMIEIAKEAGCDFVKFQLFTPSKLYSKNAGKANYLEGKEPLEMQELFTKYQLSKELLLQLHEKCQELDIGFLASSFSEEDFALLDPLVPMHKIASYEITHTPLIALAAKSQKPLLLSTGGALMEEIEVAVDLFHEEGGKDLTLLQCTASYPAEASSMNIRSIEQLKSRFGTCCGLSDHSLDPITAPVMAVAYGASVIEKHFTLSRQEQGPDHFFAIEPKELKQMCTSIRLAEKMAKSGQKDLLDTEKDLVKFAKRGLQAIQNIAQGEPFVLGTNIDILRPGNNVQGLHPKRLKELEGKKALKAISEGQGILQGDVDW